MVHARSYIIKTDSSLTLSATPNDLGILTTLDESTTGTLTILYRYGRWRMPQGFPFPNRKLPTTINLSVISSPNWCSVTLENTTLEATVPSSFRDFLQGSTINLSLTFTAKLTTSSAPAFTPGTITINASALQNGNINPSSTTLDIPVQPGFFPAIETSTSNTSLSLQPGKATNITISVTNKANAQILAEVTILSIPSEYVNIILPGLKTIDIDEEKRFQILFETNQSVDENIQNQTIILSIQYHAINDESATGTPVDIPLTVDILKTDLDEENVVDLLPFVIGIVVIFIVLYVIFTIISWRRNRYKHISE
jgi:hypothetical protein